jgi:Family of unknown function (DUF5856)
MEGANHIVGYLLAMHDTVRMYHWQTRSHARHVATCQLLSALLPLIDTLVETYMGRYQRPNYGGEGVSLHIPELSEASAVEILHAYGKWLKLEFPTFLKAHDTDLLNIRDEIVALIHQTLYRFTLA